MENIINRSIWKEITLECGLCLLIVVGLPILAIVGFALRGAVTLAAVAGVLLCALLYPISARFRKWFKIQLDIEYCHRGLRLARDVLLHPAHSWARWGRKSVTVGADDLLLSMVGPVEAVDLPAPGSHVELGQPLFRVTHGDRSVDVLSPLSGSVCETNQALALHPELMNDLPFSRGWVVRLQPDHAGWQRGPLRQEDEACDWFRSEVDRAYAAAEPQCVMANHRLCGCIDSAAWDQLSQMFRRSDTPS